MSYSDWQTNTSPVPGGSKQEFSFVMSTTLDGFSYTPSEEEKNRDAAQVVATGRKSWKTLKGIGEAVWPPQLEAALIEGLEKYDLENAGKSDKSQRYPKRNRFISDYIFEVTAKKRNPKQVGSRLQQLRDTCKNERILRLVKPRASANKPGTRASSEDSAQSSSSSASDPRSSSSPLNSHPLVGVVISLQDELFPSPFPSVSIANNGYDNVISLSPLLDVSSPSRGHSLNSLRCLSRIIELVSPIPLELETTFTVYRGESLQPLHFEAGLLRCVPYSSGRSGWIYRSELIPSFWESLCFMQGQDIKNFRILQRLKPSASDITTTVVPESVGVMYTFSVRSSLQRRSSAPSITGNDHGDLRVQPLSYPSQSIQSSVLDYPSYPAVPDNLEDNWIPHLTQRSSRASHPAVTEPRTMSQAASYYGTDPSFRMQRGQTEMTSAYLQTTTTFDPHYPVDESREGLHAPVPVLHHQQFNVYHPYSHL